MEAAHDYDRKPGDIEKVHNLERLAFGEVSVLVICSID
jgi:hypothetical protein